MTAVRKALYMGFYKVNNFLYIRDGHFKKSMKGTGREEKAMSEAGKQGIYTAGENGGTLGACVLG